MKGFVRLKIIWIIFLLIQAFNGAAQNLKECYIECDQYVFDYMNENYQEVIYIPINITFGGNTWTDVELRIRGDSSRDYPKKSLKARFNDNPFITGESVLNFNAEYHDLSYMHSFLCSALFEKAGIASPHMEHVRLYLNDNFLGLYLMTENIDENFLSDNGWDPSGNLYKATLDGACLSIYDNIFYHWELKSGEDPYRDELSNLINELNGVLNDNYISFLQSNFHYSNLISFLAMNMLLSNGSTYYHNYFLFQNVYGGEKWEFVPWDLDRTFSDYGIYYRHNRSSGPWTPDNPILEKSLINEVSFSDIKDRIEQLQTTFFQNEFLFPIIDSLQYELTTSVLEDRQIIFQT